MLATPSIVDLFCGFGGVTFAARRREWKVVAAINHWQVAIRTHAANHPTTLHMQEHLHSGTNWHAWQHHVPDVLWASCSCQGHSSAAQPVRATNPKLAAQHDDYRMTMWCVVQAASAWLPRVVVVENVPAVLGWPQLPAWRMALELADYQLVQVKLTSSRHGVPQRRRRVFFVAVRGRGAKRAAAELARTLVDPATPEPAIGPHLDFNAGVWTPFAELGSARNDKVRPRAEEAHRRFNGGPCWLQNVTSPSVHGRSITEPVTSITGANQHALVHDRHYRLFSVDETKAAQGFPRDYQIPEGVTRSDALLMIANAVPPNLADFVLACVEAVL